jgi:outer membrane protein OmpA-like peptidoglycan-associated protein
MKYNGKYMDAKPLFLDFVKKYTDDEGKEIRKRARMEAAGCEDALVLMQNPLKITVNHLGSSVNNPYSDFGPAADGNDALTFSSIKSDTVVAVGGPTRASYVCRIYKSTRNGAKWTKGKEYGEEINSDEDHTGNPAFSSNGKMMAFTRCREKSNIDLHITCELYMSTRSSEKGKWSKPIKLGPEVNAPNTTNSQPTIGRSETGENVLYFVSDRKSANSQGGLDIWYASFKRDGSTGNEFNCGKKVNTTEDDCTPYYDDRNGLLYFSSNGRVGMGGFDIYYAKGWGKKFDFPENVGYPINSSVDDRYFTLTPNHKGGFFVSNRPGGFELKSPTCCDDIFEFKYIIDPVFAVKGYVFSTDDKEKKHPLEKVTVVLLNDDQTFVAKDSSSRKKLKYFFNTQKDHKYVIKAGKEKYFTSTVTVSFEGKTESDTQRIDIFIKPIIIKPIKIQGLFYDFDKATLRPESGPSLDTLLGFLHENPTIKIQINSHTDNKGSDDYNMRLSQERAQSVVDFLTGHGIASERLAAKGYGETDPLVPNSNPNGTDNPENRQLNRRTEFVVIGSVEGAIITYEQGRPVVIDSTASTHELQERERRGQVRAQLDASGNEIESPKDDAQLDLMQPDDNGEKRQIQVDDTPIENTPMATPVPPAPKPTPKPANIAPTPASNPKGVEDDEDEIPAPKPTQVVAPKPTVTTPPANNNSKPVVDDEDEEVKPAPKPSAPINNLTPANSTGNKTNNDADEDDDVIVTKPQPKPAAPVTTPAPAPAAAQPTVTNPAPAPQTPAPAAVQPSNNQQPRNSNISNDDDEDEAPAKPQPKTEELKTIKAETKTVKSDDEDEDVKPAENADKKAKGKEEKKKKEPKAKKEKVKKEEKKQDEKVAEEKKEEKKKEAKPKKEKVKKEEKKVEEKTEAVKEEKKEPKVKKEKAKKESKKKEEAVKSETKKTNTVVADEEEKDEPATPKKKVSSDNDDEDDLTPAKKEEPKKVENKKEEKKKEPKPKKEKKPKEEKKKESTEVKKEEPKKVPVADEDDE